MAKKSAKYITSRSPIDCSSLSVRKQTTEGDVDSILRFGYSQKVIFGLFRLIFYLIIAGLVYLFFRLLLSPRPRARSGRPPRRTESGVMVKDEVCNTYLSRDDAILENWQGKEFFFCSSECRRKFLEGRKG